MGIVLILNTHYLLLIHDMNHTSTSDMLGALDRGKFLLEKTEPADFRELSQKQEYIDAFNQLQLLVKRIRYFGSIDNAIAVLDTELKKKQTVLFGYSEALKTDFLEPTTP